MHRIILAIAIPALVATGAYAQAGQAGSSNPAVKDSTPHKVSTPAKGDNSFTEGQAKGRLEKAGYSNISSLKKTNDLWRAEAMKDGRKVSVSLDYKGNITTH